MLQQWMNDCYVYDKNICLCSCILSIDSFSGWFWGVGRNGYRSYVTLIFPTLVLSFSKSMIKWARLIDFLVDFDIFFTWIIESNSSRQFCKCKISKLIQIILRKWVEYSYILETYEINNKVDSVMHYYCIMHRSPGKINEILLHWPL
jgi:hypothetical protein